VHEARGLDVLPSTVQKFRGNGDAESAALLEDVIYAVCVAWPWGGGGGGLGLFWGPMGTSNGDQQAGPQVVAPGWLG